MRKSRPSIGSSTQRSRLVESGGHRADVFRIFRVKQSKRLEVAELGVIKCELAGDAIMQLLIRFRVCFLGGRRGSSSLCAVAVHLTYLAMAAFTAFGRFGPSPSWADLPGGHRTQSVAACACCTFV